MTIMTELKHSWIITIKEFRQLSRKKALMLPLFLFPIIMIVFFGYGMGGTVKNAPILIINDDTGTASNSLVQEIGSYTPKYGGDPMFSVTYTKDMSQSEAKSKIDYGSYKAVLIIPQDYSERLAKNETTTLTLLTDSSDTTTSGIIINFMKQFLAKTGSVSLNIPDVYGDLEYLDFLTPAVIALTIFFGSVATTGSAIAGEIEDGTIPNLNDACQQEICNSRENSIPANIAISQSCYPDICSICYYGIQYEWQLASCCSGACYFHSWRRGAGDIHVGNRRRYGIFLSIKHDSHPSINVCHRCIFSLEFGS